MPLSQASLDVIAAAQASYAKFRAHRGPPVSVSLAQYAVESDWGAKVSGTNNFFGIKANAAQVAAGEFTERWTKEQLPSGQTVSLVQKFANYDSLQGAFDAHATLLTTPHYTDCMNAETPEDYCQALQKDGYATAHNYATVLIKTINDNRLKQYDVNTAPAGQPASAAGGGGEPDPAAGATKSPPVTNPAPAPSPAPATPPVVAPVPPVAPPPLASSAPPLTPVLAPPIKIDYGDFLVQFISHLEPIAESAVIAGENLAANSIPGGNLILAFFGQKMVSQFVASSAASIEALVAGKSLSISPTNALETMVLNAINAELPTLAAFFNADLPGWISAAVAKIAPTLGAAKTS